MVYMIRSCLLTTMATALLVSSWAAEARTGKGQLTPRGKNTRPRFATKAGTIGTTGTNGVRKQTPARPRYPSDSAAKLCQRFARDRKCLDNDRSVEWVEGWHGVRKGNLARAIPGILADQGLFVSKSVSFMPTAAYWHADKPPTPDHWKNSGAMVHFRVPRLYLERMGQWVQDRCAGNRFKHESSVGAPRSRSNPNQEIMPVQVLKVYWVQGNVPDPIRSLGVDVRGKSSL